jgi:large subunit ribosomal protein L29
MTKVTDFRGRTVDELKDAIASLKKEQFNLRFQKASGQLEATGRVQVVRRDIARIKTILGERGRVAPQAKA